MCSALMPLVGVRFSASTEHPARRLQQTLSAKVWLKAASGRSESDDLVCFQRGLSEITQGADGRARDEW